MSCFDQVIEIFEDKLNIPNNAICIGCDSSYKQPLLPWQIGSNFFTPEGGIFIAGKPHRGVPGDVLDSGIIDGREVGKHLFFNESWPYWSYTKEALNAIYHSPENSWEHIAFSNIVKCTNTDSTDKTTWDCAKKCITENKVIFEEIELLKPRKVVFFTWSMHRNLLTEIPFAIEKTIENITDSNFQKKCGAKQLGWWDRSFVATWGEKIDLLVVGHPERMKKNEYVEILSEWLSKP